MKSMKHHVVKYLFCLAIVNQQTFLHHKESPEDGA